MLTIRSGGPHGGQPVFVDGAPLGSGRATLVLLHGRGASAEDMLDLARAVGEPDVSVLAPQAVGHTWYPNRFLAPIESNEPWLGSALAAVDDVLAHAEAAGVSPGHIVLGGFSQGACLALEYAVRRAPRLGGVAGLSGGLIGPPGTRWPEEPGRLEGLPVFLGCSDVDPHIPVERVHESARVFQAGGALVTVSIYPGMGHTVNGDEIRRLREMIAAAGTR